MLAAALFSSAPALIHAQNEQSPYSRYGYGMIGDFATSAQRNMGGIGIAMNDGRHINVMNPASYAATDSLTLTWDIGVDLTRLWSEDNGYKGKSFGGGLDYLTMMFPIGKYMGGSIGLVPYTTVGYSFGSDVKDNDGNKLANASSSGYGGLNELYIGVSGRLFDGMTLGANVAYQFGTIVNDTYLIEAGGSAQSLFEQAIQIRDWDILLGLQYSKEFRGKHRLTFGANYAPGKDFHGKTWGVKYDLKADEKPDTVGHSRLKGGYSKPHAFGVGIAYTFDQRLSAEADFSYQQWSKANFEGIRDDKGEVISRSVFDDRWKVAVGLQFIPKTRGNYLQRIAYRLGGFYTRDYIMIGANHVKEYGVSIGFGMPTMGTKTEFNLGFEFKRRQAYPASLVTENYFNITLGINFKEFAFWRDKIR